MSRFNRDMLREARENYENDVKMRARVRMIFEIAATLALAALVAVCFFQSVIMQESSMEPTISVGARFFINMISYRIGDPQRGDIVVFKTNGSDEAALHIRRIIGLPGETVQIVNGRVLVDGATLKEAGDFPTIVNPGAAETPVTLETNQYFVLGDNRNNSEDSRFGDIGIIKKEYLVGKLWFTIAPLKKLGFFR